MLRSIFPILDLDFMRTPSHRLLLVWLLTIAVCAGVARDVAASEDWPDPAVLEDAVTEALGGKQTHLDPHEMDEAAPPRGAMISMGGGTLGSFFELLSYVLLAAGVVLLITVVLQKTGVLDRGARTEAVATEDEVVVEDAAVSRAPDAAVAAAARGEFGEALRLLLGEVLPRFYRGHGAGWPEAWTSRQCLRRVVRAEPARGDLAGLIGAVERHHFGGQPAVRSDWDQWERQAGGLRPSAAVQEMP